ncbi:MAG: hypothetical protein IPM35_30575 [Myxococcales bacterium]|nr:hypothetical protein [Myxococcales bacterium]
MIFDRLCEIDLEIDDDGELDVEYEPVPEGEYEYEYEYEHVHEHEHEHAGVDELLEQKVSFAFEPAGGSEPRAAARGRETANTLPVLGTSRSRSATEAWTPENAGGAGGSFLVRSPSREAPPDAEREERTAERSDGESGTTFTVLGTSRSRSATEARTPENAGEAGGSFLVRSESREALHVDERTVSRASELAGDWDCRAERSDGETGTTSKVFAMIRSRSATEAWTPENAGGAGGSLLVRSDDRQTSPVARREMKNPRAARAHALRSTGSDDPTGGHHV